MLKQTSLQINLFYFQSKVIFEIDPIYFCRFKRVDLLKPTLLKQRGTNIPSVAFSKIQDLSFLHLVIICPAYATDRRVSQTVKQD